MTLREFIKPYPEFVLLDISAYSKETGGECFKSTIRELKDIHKMYLDYTVVYACPELSSLSYCCVGDSNNVCILLDIKKDSGEKE